MMKKYPVSVERADETFGYATIYYSTGPTVTVEVTGISSPGGNWRIRGRGSDTEVYLPGQGLGIFTFDSANNMNYAFQIQNGNGNWVNTSNLAEQAENAFFSVVFESEGGDSGGDSGGGNWEIDGKCTLHINEGNGTKITVRRTWTDYDGGLGVLQDGADIWYPADRFQITAEALPGYKIDYYTSDDGEYLPFIMDNLTKPYAGEPYQLSWNSDATVSTTATRSTNIRIDDGSSFDNKYCLCIDTEHVIYPDNGLHCSVIGQRTCKGYSGITLENDYNTTNNGWWGAYYGSNGGVIYYSHHIKFKTPGYIDSPTNLTIKIKMDGYNINVDPTPTMRYALCSSDINYPLYGQTTSEVSDEYQIISGTFNENTTVGGTSDIVINGVFLDPDTVYYLIIWDAHNTVKSGGQTYISPASEHSIVADHTGNEPVYYIKFDRYFPYIDNGTSWEPF